MEKNCKYNCVKGYCLSWNAGFDEIKCTEIDSLASPTPSFEPVVGEPKEESTPDQKTESKVWEGWLRKRIDIPEHQWQYFHLAFSDILQELKESKEEVNTLRAAQNKND